MEITSYNIAFLFSEIFTIYSIVNSLTELDTVASVQFLVEGEKKEALSHMALNEPIARNSGIIVE